VFKQNVFSPNFTNTQQFDLGKKGGYQNQVWFRPAGGMNSGGIAQEDKFSISKSLMLSPVNCKDHPTKPSMQGTSSNTSFDMNCFSFNNEENGSNYYAALVGPDG